MSEEWGPWIAHDGRGCPKDWPGRGGHQRRHDHTSGFLTDSPGEIERNYTSAANPGWVWRWRRSWLPPFRRRRVCDDPDWQPIIAVRFRKPPAVSAQVTALRAIAAGTSHPTGPEGPRRVRKTEST